ncbi:MAG TPA: substrate-binding domain-containing protein [Candidatus Kapabacteria bacterium]|nr:substrate-binding domain-containing protein [Candidatus Kapabacteria bacterium]
MRTSCRTVIALSLVLLLSCGKQQKPVAIPDTATSGSFELVADETLKPAVDSLVTGFNLEMPNAHVTVRYMDAASALDALLQNKTRLVLTARPLTKKERSVLDSQKIDLPEFDVALEGLAVIVSRDNPRNSISLDSLRQLCDGKLSEHYYSTSYLSATEAILDSIFNFSDKTLSGRISRLQTTDSVISAVKSDPAGIGFISSSWMHELTAKGDSSVKSLRISSAKSDEPVQLHLAYLYQGNYPLASRVCAYTNELPNTLPRGFLAYAMTANGQRVFMKYDVLPRTQIIRIVPSK